MAPAIYRAFVDNPAFIAALNVAKAAAQANGVDASTDDVAIIGAAILSAFAAEGGFRSASRRRISAASAEMLRELMAPGPRRGRSPCPSVPLNA